MRPPDPVPTFRPSRPRRRPSRRRRKRRGSGTYRQLGRGRGRRPPRDYSYEYYRSREASAYPGGGYSLDESDLYLDSYGPPAPGEFGTFENNGRFTAGDWKELGGSWGRRRRRRR